MKVCKELEINVLKVYVLEWLCNRHNNNQRKTLNNNNINCNINAASQAEGHGFESRCPLSTQSPVNLIVCRAFNTIF